MQIRARKLSVSLTGQKSSLAFPLEAVNLPSFESRNTSVLDQSLTSSKILNSNSVAAQHRDLQPQGRQPASSSDLRNPLRLIVSVHLIRKALDGAALHATVIPHFEAGLQHQPYLDIFSTRRISTVRRSGIMLSQGGQRMPEYRHMSTGSLNIPPPSANGSGGPTTPLGGMGRFEGPRSPPGRQSEFMTYYGTVISSF